MTDRRDATNVLGRPLEDCCLSLSTGYFRDGTCRTDPTDRGAHVVCAEMTAEFLAFSKESGNDLSTPRPEWNFPGLKPGDRWCVCANRWKEALEAGAAPPVCLQGTEVSALKYVTLMELTQHALD